MMNYNLGIQILSDKKRMLPFAFILIVLEFLLFFEALPPMVFGLVSFSLSSLIGMIAYITHVFTEEIITESGLLSEITCTKCGYKNQIYSELCTRCGCYLDRAHN
ncbi:MAG: hypothetical protein ACFFA1_07155 [Promethearchaeota archaeon]